MRLKHVSLVLGKEMLNTIRDRRTLVIMIVVPLLLMPLIVLGPSLLRVSMEESRQSEAQEIAVINANSAPGLLQLVETNEGLEIVDVDDPTTALSEGEIAAILVVPEGFETNINNEEMPEPIEIRFDLSSETSQTAQGKLEGLLAQYRQRVVDQRISDRGISPEILNPFSSSSVNVAPPERVSGFFLGLMLPLFLILWAAIGGAQTAIDVTAGEKERQTLESILVTPTSRSSIVVGKFISIFIVSISATVLALGGFALSLTFGGNFFPDTALFDAFQLALAPDTLAWLFATTAVVAAMMSALTFALFLWTRNFKEAQSYTTYLSFGVMIPAFVVSFGGAPGEGVSYLIPIYNATAIIKELLLGDINLTHILLTYASSAVLAIIGLSLSVRMFNNESVLFRQ